LTTLWSDWIPSKIFNSSLNT